MSPSPADFDLDDFNNEEKIKNKNEVEDRNQKNKNGIFNTMEDEMVTYDPSSEKNYLTEIFKII